MTGQSGIVEYLMTDVRFAFYPDNPHTYDPQLVAVMNAFKKNDFGQVRTLLLNLSEDYRSYALAILSTQGKKSTIQKWINQSDDELPRILMGMRVIDKAWQARGGDFYDELSATQIMMFHGLLDNAEDILSNIKNTDSEFEVNRLIALMQIYKGLYNDITAIEKLFNKAVGLKPYHIELHVEYFDAISVKWGGYEEGVQHYLTSFLPSEPILLHDCVMALYYRDLLEVEGESDPQVLAEIKNFVSRVFSQRNNPDILHNLHRATLYEYMVQIAKVHSVALMRRYEKLLIQCYKKP